MDPVTLRSEISTLIEGALRELLPDGRFPVQVSASRNPDFGDLSCQVAMQLARELGKPPIRIAEEIAGRIAADLPEGTAVSIAAPGFLNFTLSAGYLASVLYGIATEGLGQYIPAPGSGMKALVEFVSSNPTGPLTVGHCRQAVLGEAVSRLLETLGWAVEREYYFNDTGRQMELLGESLSARYEELLGRPLKIPEGGYQGEYLAKWASDLRQEKGDGLHWETDGDSFIGYARDRAMNLIRSDLDLMGIEFDRFFRESELIPRKVEETIALLRGLQTGEGSLVYEEDDRLLLRLTALGRPVDRVIVRDNGMYTYRMPDIAYHLDKFRRGYDLIVDVSGPITWTPAAT